MKKISIFLISILLLSILAACGNSSSDNSSGDKGGTKKIRASIGLNENHPEYKGLLKFKEIVEEKTNGSIVVETYPSAQLGDDRTTAEGIQLGTLEVTIPSTAPMVNFVPEMAVFDIPFLFPDEKTADAVLDGPVGQKLMEKFESQQMVALAYWENGFRNLTNSKHEVKSMADFKGLKIRTMENEFHIEAFKRLGANPTPMAMGEVFTALQQGTVDGQENPFPTIYLEGFYEVQDYVTDTKHIYSPFIFLMGKKFYDGLTEEEQTIVKEAAIEAGKYEREMIREENENSLKGLKEKGMTYTELTPEAREEMKKAVQPVVDKISDKVGKELVDEIRQAVEDAQK